jgi:hypothetical protein
MLVMLLALQASADASKKANIKAGMKRFCICMILPPQCLMYGLIIQLMDGQ